MIARINRSHRIAPRLTFLCVTAWVGAWHEMLVCDTQADEPPLSSRTRAWVEKRVEEWQPTKAERAFDEIGWAKDLGEAEKIAKEHRRPIFLFTYDGANMACYRC